WHGGEHKPKQNNLSRLSGYFGLPGGTELRSDPLFLSPDPIGEAEQREWLVGRINNLGSDTLRELFPELKRILENR
ncbi:MAG: hypothetical protein M3P49_08130, partial [Actinomycetota bacterium]|nr:hypothetical protein [Actinomycetota bacterium]